jgi:hypothetical protein
LVGLVLVLGWLVGRIAWDCPRHSQLDAADVAASHGRKRSLRSLAGCPAQGALGAHSRVPATPTCQKMPLYSFLRLVKGFDALEWKM